MPLQPPPDPSTLREQAAALAAGAVTSRELVDASLARIDAAQPVLNPFRIVLHEEARAAADAADARLRAGERAPLLGVPFAIKDDTDLAGQETRFGCGGTHRAKTEDAEIVRRLKAAGVVIVGKTNTPEIGQWPMTEGPAFGATRNPWNTAYSPGGSSGGSAAAVAAGLVAGATGSDGAGSIRIPAAWSHLVGIKPQRGRVSTWPDPESFTGLTTHGPLARTVGDAALLLDVLSGAHPGDRHRVPDPAVPFAEAAARRPGRLRIALSLAPPWVGLSRRLDPDVRIPVERLAARLEDLGHEVIRREVSWGPVGFLFMPRSMSGIRDWSLRIDQRHRLDPRTIGNARTGWWTGGPVLAAARRLEEVERRRTQRIFRHCDVVITPTTAATPLPIGAIDGLNAYRTDQVVAGACPYTYPWNVYGLPSVAVPAGITGAGLPVGAQLLGPGRSEALLLALAGQLEEAERWHERWPPGLEPAPVAGARAA